MPFFEKWFGKHIGDSEKESACRAAYVAGLNQALEYVETLLDHACFSNSTCGGRECQVAHKITKVILETIK